MVGRQETGEAALARVERLAEQPFRRLVAEHDLTLRIQHDHRVLEAVEDPFHPRPVVLPVRLIGVHPLAQLVHSRRELSELVVPRQLDGGAVLAAGQPVHSLGDLAQRLQHEVADDEPDRDGDAERDERDRKAVERGLGQLLLEEAGGDTDPYAAEGALAQLHRHLRLVHLRFPEERGDDRERRPRLQPLEALARRQGLTRELGVTVDEDPIGWIDDGRVDDRVRVADHPLEQSADARVLLQEGG